MAAISFVALSEGEGRSEKTAMTASEHQARLDQHRRTNGRVISAANETAKQLAKGANRARTIARQAQRDLGKVGK
jgi:hypothetical protein